MEVEKLREEVLTRVRSDLLAADAQCSLFVAALSSYRQDTVLRPFPPMFVSESSETRTTNNHHTEKNYKQLEKACEELPSMQEITKYGLECVDDQLVKLLHWIFSNKTYTLKSLPRTYFDEICQKTGCTDSVAKPNFIFELDYSASIDSKFSDLRGSRDVFYAFHGSRVENFHSITNLGLHAHMNKNSLFGEGTYLSSELAVSMPYAPTGKAWDKSIMGQKLSCFAVCEIIDDPSVKCQIKDESGSSRSRSKAPESMGGEVPEKYYIVRNNEMQRVRYLVVYAERNQNSRKTTPSWLYSHRFTLMIALYGLLLIFIGLYNSKTFHYSLNRFLKSD